MMTAYPAVEVAIGSYAQRGVLWDRNNLAGLPKGVPLWRSMFIYNRGELQSYLDEHGTLRGDYPGAVYVDNIVLDLDGESAIRDAQKAVSMLIDRGVMLDSFAVYSSGQKGIHIHLARTLFSKHIRMEDVKATVEEHFGHLDSLDTGLYHRSALIRVPNSIHQVTGRRVGAIDPSVLLSGVLENVTDLQNYVEMRDSEEPVIGGRKLTAPGTVFGTSRTKLVVSRAPKPVIHTDTTNRVVCMQRAVRTPPPEGQRHDYVLRVASWLRRLGMPSDLTETMVQTWSGFRDEKDTAQAVASVYEKQLEYSCHDHIMHLYCDDSCIFYNQKVGMKPQAKDFREQMKSLVEFRKRIAMGRGINLKSIDPLSKTLKGNYWLLPGECAIITGDTGMGKSAMIQNIVVKAKKKTLYLNLENAEELMTRRFVQIHEGGITKERALEVMMNGRMEAILDGLSHIYQVAMAPDIDEMEALVKDVNPEVVVVDTTDVIDVPGAGNNEMYQLKRVIERLRLVAQRHDVIVIAIHHINKSSAKENRVDLNSLTGNRANVTKMDHVFAIVGDRFSQFRSFRVLKSRDSEPFRMNLLFDGSRMMFEAPEDEKEEDPL